ncbi:MAG: hypothetical protein ACR2HV_04065 [Acidimicrobiales bacterium]
MKRLVGSNGLVRIAAALGIAVLLAACGGSDDETTSPGTTAAPGGGVSGADSTNATVPLSKPACDFLSQDDVGRLLGNPVKAAQQGAVTNCTWGTDVDGGSSLDLTVVKPSDGGATQACADQRRSLPRGLAKENIDDLGDSAVWSVEELTTIRQGHLLACWEDGVVIVLITGEKDPVALQGMAKAVAEEAHGRF